MYSRSKGTSSLFVNDSGIEARLNSTYNGGSPILAASCNRERMARHEVGKSSKPYLARLGPARLPHRDCHLADALEGERHDVGRSATVSISPSDFSECSVSPSFLRTTPARKLRTV
jgi:hypothetical protein